MTEEYGMPRRTFISKRWNLCVFDLMIALLFMLLLVIIPLLLGMGHKLQRVFD